MYDAIGDCQVGMDMEYLDHILTERGRLEESLTLNQFVRVTDLTYYPDKKFLIFDCDIYEHLLN